MSIEKMVDERETMTRFFIYEVHRCDEKGCGGDACDRYEPSCKSKMLWKIDIEFSGEAKDLMELLKKNDIKIISQDIGSIKCKKKETTEIIIPPSIPPSGRKDEGGYEASKEGLI